MAEMAEVAAAASDGRYSLVTLTYAPLRYEDGKVPLRHEGCDAVTHLRWFDTSGGYLGWIVRMDCPACLRRDSARFAKWRKRFRRRWPDAQLLVVREEQKSGNLHSHVVITGLPFVIRERSRAERLVREHWAAVGGGFAQAQTSKRGSATAAGRYVAKYATKSAQGARLARRYRFWRRSAGFGRGVQMFGYRAPKEGPSEWVAGRRLLGPSLRSVPTEGHGQGPPRHEGLRVDPFTGEIGI